MTSVKRKQSQQTAFLQARVLQKIFIDYHENNKQTDMEALAYFYDILYQ